MELSKLIEISKQVFEISDISKLGATITEKLNDVTIFSKWVDSVPDMTEDNLQPIFQYYMADRKEKMQDYTPKSLALAACMVAGVHNVKSVYDMCAGSGALTIQAWNVNPECRFICQEFDERVIPFLLFNLAVRNINAVVIHGDVLSEEQFKAYSVKSGENFSSVFEIPVPIEIKADCCISNPPYNMKFKLPAFAALNDRYKYGVPPENNANYAFISAAIQAADNAALILPNIVLSTKQNAEAEIRENLICSNMIDAIVENPDNMFECTSIGTCICSFKKNKQTATVEMLDMRQTFTEEVRLQKGQFGGASHTNRTYQKTVKVYSQENINSMLSAITNRRNKAEFSASVTKEELKNKKYTLVPGMYFQIEFQEPEHRPFSEIIRDYNKIVSEKNACKLVINETLAKAIKLPVLEFKQDINFHGKMYEFMEKVSGEKLVKPDYVTFTKNKGECIFKANDPEHLSTIFLSVLQMWKQHIMYLNEQENVILAEYRDAIMPELMSGRMNPDTGKIQEEKGKEKNVFDMSFEEFIGG